MVLIDTSAWLFALKKYFHPAIKDRIDMILSETDVAINGIIALELLGGTRNEKEYDRLKTRLDGLYYIESTKSLWDLSSKNALDLRRRGITIPYTDVFIATSAIYENIVLLHADTHFDHIAKHIKLKVESLVKLIR